MHYAGLSRVTTIDGLYITDLSESKIAVNHDVKVHMQQLHTDHHTKLSNTPICELDPNTFKICFLNSRSLHKHIEDIRSDRPKLFKYGYQYIIRNKTVPFR